MFGAETFGKHNNEIQMKFGGGNSDFGRDNSELGSMLGSYRQEIGGVGYKDAISELYDDNEKDAVFRSSVKRGGAMHDFNASLKGMSPA